MCIKGLTVNIRLQFSIRGHINNNSPYTNLCAVFIAPVPNIKVNSLHIQHQKIRATLDDVGEVSSTRAVQSGKVVITSMKSRSLARAVMDLGVME